MTRKTNENIKPSLKKADSTMHLRNQFKGNTLKNMTLNEKGQVDDIIPPPDFIEASFFGGDSSLPLSRGQSKKQFVGLSRNASKKIGNAGPTLNTGISALFNGADYQNLDKFESNIPRNSFFGGKLESTIVDPFQADGGYIYNSIM